MVRAGHDGLRAVLAGSRSLRHQINLGAIDWARNKRLNHGYRKARHKLHQVRSVLRVTRRYLLAQIGQSYEQRVLVKVPSHQPGHVRQRAGVEATRDALGLIDVFDYGRLVFKMRLCLPLNAHCIYRVLQREPDEDACNAKERATKQDGRLFILRESLLDGRRESFGSGTGW